MDLNSDAIEHAVLEWREAVDAGDGGKAQKLANHLMEVRVQLEMGAQARDLSPALLLLLGNFYLYGWGCEIDCARARKHYEEASTNDLAAMYQLGWRLLLGEDFLAEPEIGLRLIHDAAHGGDMDAQYFLGSGYATGSNGLPRNLDLAQKYYLLAATQNHAEAQWNLGQLLMSLGPSYRNEARIWKSRAADAGYWQGLEEAP